MLYLLLHLVGVLTFVNIARYARNDPRGFFVTGATNYSFAMVVAAAWALATRGGISLEPAAIIFGAFQGFTYQVMYLVLFVLMGLGGLAISTTINRMAILVPTIYAILVWGEQPTPERYLGIAAIVLATPLLGLDAQRYAVRTKQGGWLLPAMILISFALLGGSEIGAKWFVEARGASDPVDYAFWLFAAATICSLFTWPLANRMARREWERNKRPGQAPTPFKVQVNLRSIGFGMALGVAHWGQVLALISALTVFDASFVFPFATASMLVLISVIDYVFWGQRFSPVTVTGLVVAGFGVILINLNLGFAEVFA